jgi:hypothetical protein
VPPPDAATLTRLIEELDSSEFKVRQHATEQLCQFGNVAAPALRRALEGDPSVEVQKRIHTLLDQLNVWTPQRLCEHRALQALKRMSEQKSKAVLEALAAGAPGARLTQEAKASLERLAKRQSVKP